MKHLITEYWGRKWSPLTSTLGSADQRGSRRASPTLSRPREENTDAIFSIRLQVPDFIRQWVDSVCFRPGRMAGPVHDLSADHRPIAHYRVSVELDDQVGGARAQQLGWSYRCGRDYRKRKKQCWVDRNHTLYVLSGWLKQKHPRMKLSDSSERSAEQLVLHLTDFTTNVNKSSWIKINNIYWILGLEEPSFWTSNAHPFCCLVLINIPFWLCLQYIFIVHWTLLLSKNIFKIWFWPL